MLPSSDPKEVTRLVALLGKLDIQVEWRQINLHFIGVTRGLLNP